jgi:hypothetical protein
MAKSEIKAKEAKHGQKMIEVKIRFWTNDMAKGKDEILPKHAWSSGVVRIEKNKSHGIKPSTPRPFNSLLDIGSVVEKVLIDHKITLHRSSKMKKYFDA